MAKNGARAKSGGTIEAGQEADKKSVRAQLSIAGSRSRVRLFSLVGSILLVTGIWVMQRSFGTVGLVVILASAFIVVYVPLAVLQLLFLQRNSSYIRQEAANTPLRPIVSGRRVLSVITTNGQNPEVVDKIIDVLKTYVLPGPFEVRVLVEEKDPFVYRAPTIRVPSDYQTPNRSILKMRALHFFSEWLRTERCGSETYVVHLDDDSVPSEDYLQWVYRMTEEAGQGNVRLREHGSHLFSTMADLVRVSDCCAWCVTFNRRGKPMAVHGEGLVIRADVESALGWDFATYGADDFLMGQKLVHEGKTFGCIPHEIYIAPPTSAMDFYRQRRRWLISILWARREAHALRPIAIDWVLYRYLVGWLGFFGVGLFLYGLIFRPPIPLPIELLGLFNFGSYLTFYLYGAAQTKRSYFWLIMVLLIPVALFEGGTLLYSVIFPPDPKVFYVIRKV